MRKMLAASEATVVPAAAVGLWQRIFSSDALLCAALVAVNLICYSDTLDGYFLADDFVHIPFLEKVWQGHAGLIFRNFFSNWMQSGVTQFYRPLISITLAADYGLWGANAFGFHLTNILYQIASSLFLFLATSRLLRGAGLPPAKTAAFFTAALFAASPLHPEVVSWIIGRVDGVCTAFYLAAFWLFLKARQDHQRWAMAASLVSFALSLLSKEMAVSLPAMLTLLWLLTRERQSGIRQRLRSAIESTWAFWLVLMAYLAIRTMALGTPTGGYSGSVGEGLTTSFYKRFVEDGSFLRVLFPINGGTNQQGDWGYLVLQTLYCMIGAAFLMRLVTRGLATRYVVFAIGWFVLTLVPTVQVWVLTDTLQGSRFVYLGTAALALLIGVLVLPKAPGETSKYRWSRGTGLVCLSGLLVCFCLITRENNRPWLQASSEVLALKSGLEETLAALPPGKKLVLLNIPQSTGGAHMIYNAAMLEILLKPPLSRKDLSSRVVTFEPMTYGDSELMIISRLRRMLLRPHAYAFYRWSRQDRRLVELKLVACEREVRIHAGSDCESGPLLQFSVSPELGIPSTATDFVDVFVSAMPQSKKQNSKDPNILILAWSDSSGSLPPPDAKPLFQALVLDGKIHRYRFAVSEHKSWVACTHIKRIKLCVGPGPCDWRLERVELVNGKSEIPCLSCDRSTVVENNAGLCSLKEPVGGFFFDVSSIPGAQGVAVELSKPNAWFEHYSGTFREKKLTGHQLKFWQIDKTKGKFQVAAETFPAAGYYQLRIAATKTDGVVIRYVSDPINLHIRADQCAPH